MDIHLEVIVIRSYMGIITMWKLSPRCYENSVQNSRLLFQDYNYI